MTNIKKIVWNGVDGYVEADVAARRGYDYDSKKCKLFQGAYSYDAVDAIEVDVKDLPLDENGDPDMTGVLGSESGKFYKLASECCLPKIQPRKRKQASVQVRALNIVAMCLIKLLKKELEKEKEPSGEQKFEMTDEKMWKIITECTTDGPLDVDKFIREVEEAYKLKGLTA